MYAGLVSGNKIITVSENHKILAIILDPPKYKVPEYKLGQTLELFEAEPLKEGKGVID